MEFSQKLLLKASFVIKNWGKTGFLLIIILLSLIVNYSIKPEMFQKRKAVNLYGLRTLKFL